MTSTNKDNIRSAVKKLSTDHNIVLKLAVDNFPKYKGGSVEMLLVDKSCCHVSALAILTHLSKLLKRDIIKKHSTSLELLKEQLNKNQFNIYLITHYHSITTTIDGHTVIIIQYGDNNTYDLFHSGYNQFTLEEYINKGIETFTNTKVHEYLDGIYKKVKEINGRVVQKFESFYWMSLEPNSNNTKVTSPVSRQFIRKSCTDWLTTYQRDYKNPSAYKKKATKF